jgi:AraC-like DNA-binding protein
VTRFRRINRPPLSRFVDFFWLAEGYTQTHRAEAVLPTGCVDLILSLDEQPEADVIAGARSQSIVIDTSRALSFIGVRFRPGGAFPFLPLPLGELEGLSVAPTIVWGSGARILREKLLESGTAEDRFEVLERFLIERLKRSRERQPAVQYALDIIERTQGTASVADLVEHTGLTARRFIASFRDEVGLAPKVFCRLARFRRVIRSLQEVQEVDWADIALGCGYFDQSHFIHDFRAFAGVGPSAYLRQRTASVNHLRIAE